LCCFIAVSMSSSVLSMLPSRCCFCAWKSWSLSARSGGRSSIFYLNHKSFQVDCSDRVLSYIVLKFHYNNIHYNKIFFRKRIWCFGRGWTIFLLYWKFHYTSVWYTEILLCRYWTSKIFIYILQVMEQQTLSIAKAGIICQLNARTSILAAANPSESQWNKNKTIVENIMLPHTLMSRWVYCRSGRSVCINFEQIIFCHPWISHLLIFPCLFIPLAITDNQELEVCHFPFF
jgi:hypothetical protein